MRRDHGSLAHGHAVVAVEHAAELREVLVQARTVVVEAHAAGAGHHEVVVGQALDLADEGDDVLAEAVHAHIEPEVHDALDLGAHGGVVHVEVGLALGEDVQVPLVEGGLVLPRAALEEAVPVVGRDGHAVLLGTLPPNVVVVERAVLAGTARLEPRVLHGGVVDHEVHDHLETALVRAVEHLLENLEVAVLGIDGAVVGDVVAVVRIGRWVERAEPDARHAQAGDVIELLEHTPQVADSVAVAVLEAARPDLVEDRVLVPARAFHDASRMDHWDRIPRPTIDDQPITQV